MLRFKTSTGMELNHLWIDSLHDFSHAIFVKRGKGRVIKSPVQKIIVCCVPIPIHHATRLSISIPVVDWQIRCYFHPMALRLHISVHGRSMIAYVSSRTFSSTGKAIEGNGVADGNTRQKYPQKLQGREF